MSTTTSKRILSVGLVCLDTVNVVKTFPVEDTDQRTVDQYQARGGNANNSASVLAEIGERVEYFGTLAADTLELAVIERDWKAVGIIAENCPRHAGFLCPNSSIIVNESTGSRTIIHTNKDLPEPTPEEFEALDLDLYSWIHFEGRNMENVKKMMAHVKKERPELQISVEVEKVGRGYEEFVPLADVVLLSKENAMAHGAKTMMGALEIFRPKLKAGGQLICAWGDQGAAAIDGEGRKWSSPVFTPPQGIVDTLGAGDTFNGTVIGALSHGMHVRDAIRVGCKVAGAKVGQRGFRGLRSVYQGCEEWAKLGRPFDCSQAI